MRVLLLLFASATAYKLSRLGPKGNGVPKVDGYACIPVPKDKLVAPGQRASMHIYDSSSLEVVRYAQAHANSTYGQVVIDGEAMQDRRFALLEVGSRVKLLSVTPSVHRDKFGGSSPSFKAEVIGVGLIEPAAVLQKMPFMTVRPAKEECSLLSAGGGVAAPGPGAAAALAEAAEICQGLEELASFKGPMTRKREVEGSTRTIDECVQQVLALRGCEGADEGTRVLLSALAATAFLPGDSRFEAMLLAQRGEGTAAVALVHAALEEESRRRLALKALSGLSAE